MIWLTCDEDNEDIIDVWSESPQRDDYTKSWWSNEEHDLGTLTNSLARPDCKSLYGIAPTDSNELVVL